MNDAIKERKVVLLIVEGPSDETALGAGLQGVFDETEVRVEVLHCDVTVKDGHDAGTIREAMGDVVAGFLAKNAGALGKADILRIIHVVDTDGAFAPDRVIVEDPQCGRVQYSTEGIKAANRERLARRNEQKRKCLGALVKTKAVMGIPYRVYFMACNLEHALHGRLNCTDKEKRRLAEAFEDEYGEDVERFKRFIAESPFSVDGPFGRSWDFIRQDLESLKRHTNLGLCWQEA